MTMIDKQGSSAMTVLSEHISLDGLTKTVTTKGSGKDPDSTETVPTTLGEAVGVFEAEILAAVVGVVPAALGGEVDVKGSGDDAATVTIKLSRNQASSRLPQK